MKSKFSYEIKFKMFVIFFKNLWDEPNIPEGHQFAISAKSVNWLWGPSVGGMGPGPGCQPRTLPCQPGLGGPHPDV